ncbi:cyclin-dependent kinase 2-interacting protein isoform X1 [Thalassophryne amazonica]|uniref:cyclin-dependent kinase 2-interacting protein isoform X1 n=1 Tax=Thalassophryne amazonica TaxID=390379 RepID=UPI0014712C67|nr:cyclin-dependent kinase 2-interacting protein isoform X1 [Thalassophryne amazonica]
MDDTPVTSVNRKCSAVTGSARKIKDNAADWHNLMLRWEKLNNEGFSAAEKIVNLRMTCSQSEQQLLVNDSSSSSPLQQQTGRANAPSAELQEECCKLQDMLDRMVAVVLKMERLLASQQGILDLEEFQFGAEGRTSPLFHSWSTKQFSLHPTPGQDDAGGSAVGDGTPDAMTSSCGAASGSMQRFWEQLFKCLVLLMQRGPNCTHKPQPALGWFSDAITHLWGCWKV